jgi:hypothetical protein
MLSSIKPFWKLLENGASIKTLSMWNKQSTSLQKDKPKSPAVGIDHAKLQKYRKR